MGVVMPTLRQGFEERNLAMTKEAEKLVDYWGQRLAAECPEQSIANRESIIFWLLGSDWKRFDHLNSEELRIAKQSMVYRWKILRQRYLGIGRERAYHHLLNRLASLVTLRNKIQTWISLSRDRHRSVIDVLQEVIQELLQNDKYIQQQMADIAEFTSDKRLRDNLLFTSIEEYAMRPVRNQPLLVYRFVNYLRRMQRGGLTQVPGSDLVKLVSEEILSDDHDYRVNLADNQAIAEYQAAQQLEEQQALRQLVQQEFTDYLQTNLGQEAVTWLQLYLQGKSQDHIAKQLHKPIKEIYRLREKISYHAVRVFALKAQPELVDNWLGISLQANNLGLTQKQWQQLHNNLTPARRQILDLLKAGNSIEAIAQQLKLKTHQAMGEWVKIYLAAQSLRTDD
ncbi:HetZ-related protein 2 [Nodularia harveyana UHCC-0300]|uniref:HetZ-related protein 2 n=1 Tax=Nodularia harveyana UHCC-0300 TaxID=2974287 RepID=A0ABU5UIY2_9CYAN|nr:HetZ-related protein 2 [Nodularia harveyana]MEA5583065.1 HetZ-related protein 2 [Nodularia harveyana UHCC-0300]